MAFIPVPDAVLARIHFTLGTVLSLEASINLWFYMPGFDDDDLDLLSAALGTTFISPLMEPLCNELKADRLDLYDMRAVDGTRKTYTINYPGGQGVGFDPVAAGDALCISFRGSKRGKWNQGRNFIPGIAEQSSDFDGVSQETADDVLAAYQLLMAGPLGGFIWVICSRYLNKLPRTSGVVAPVTSVILRNRQWAFQKRRQRRP